MSEMLLHAEPREATGKKYAKQLRREGKIPAVFYTQGEKSVPVVLDERETMKILTSNAGLIDVQIGKKQKRKAIVKDVQSDPIKQNLIHVDLMGVKLTEKITVSVPVRIIGEPLGVKEQGGMLHQYLREIEVSCLPLNIPEHIDIDVSNLEIGDSIALNTLSLENATIVGDTDQLIVNVMAPTIVQEAEEVAEGVEEETEEGAEDAAKDEAKEGETQD